MKNITLFLLLINLIFSKSKTEKIIEDFLYARYSGDTTTIKKMVSESFLYKNIPYVGLNLTTKNENGSLIVTGNINRKDSLSTSLFGIGDTIHEIENKQINDIHLPILGPVNSTIKMIMTKFGDSTFTMQTAKLIPIQLEDKISSFLYNISEYDKLWYEFDLNIIQILSKRNISMVYYKWNGIKIKDGPIFEFYRMEYIKTDKKTGLIQSIEGLWSQSQFLDQLE